MSLLMKPGSTLLLAGIALLLISRVIDIVPFVGGTLSFGLVILGLFGLVGGVWLIMSERRHANE